MIRYCMRFISLCFGVERRYMDRRDSKVLSIVESYDYDDLSYDELNSHIIRLVSSVDSYLRISFGSSKS